MEYKGYEITATVEGSSAYELDDDGNLKYCLFDYEDNRHASWYEIACPEDDSLEDISDHSFETIAEAKQFIDEVTSGNN